VVVVVVEGAGVGDIVGLIAVGEGDGTGEDAGGVSVVGGVSQPTDSNRMQVSNMVKTDLFIVSQW